MGQHVSLLRILRILIFVFVFALPALCILPLKKKKKKSKENYGSVLWFNFEILNKLDISNTLFFVFLFCCDVV